MADHVRIDGRYELLETVAERPGSSVHKAFDHKLGLVVALKTLVVQDSGAREDLFAETKALQLLEPHPGLPRLRNDFDRADGSYVVVIDWVDGVDLDAKLERDGRPGLVHSSVVDWVGQVAASLDHLHTQDTPIVHGDVKPSNIVLTKTNRVVLLDFGIARMAGQTSQAGTRGFMAPEVAAGDPVTPATDVYGLAATTYALLTGVPPAPGHFDIPDVEASVIAQLRQVLQHGLAMDPAHRHATAGEFAERLRAKRSMLPPGNITLLATEVVDFDALWDEKPTLMDEIGSRVEALVRVAVDDADGHISLDSGGERMLAGFLSASAAFRTALAIRNRLADDPWLREHDVRLRIALHTGEPEHRSGLFRGASVNKVHRLCRAAEPGQIVVSGTTAPLLADRLPAGTRLVEIPSPPSAGSTTPSVPLYSVESDDLHPLVVAAPRTPPPGPVVPPPASSPPPRRRATEQMAALLRARDELDAEVQRRLVQESEAQRAGQAELAAKYGQQAADAMKRLQEVQREIERLEAEEGGSSSV